jgi:hypothetical protein
MMAALKKRENCATEWAFEAAVKAVKEGGTDMELGVAGSEVGGVPGQAFQSSG